MRHGFVSRIAGMTAGLVLALSAGACQQGGGYGGGNTYGSGYGGGYGVPSSGGGRTGEALGTIGGAVAGGLAGSRFGGGTGKVASVAAGTLLGAFLGNQLGSIMDQRSQQEAGVAERQALSQNQPVAWDNPQGNTHGTVTPIRTYQSNGRYCRDYQHTVFIDGRPQEARGTACQNTDGSWQLVS